MSKRSITRIFLLLLISSLTYAPATSAEGFDGFSSGVFKFQKKLAEKGQVSAQYKLGRMYETGQGTEVDLNSAMQWYSKAAENGSVAASDRMKYYEIKTLGYNSDSYGGWVDTMIDRSRQRDTEAMTLLAEMYSDGIGVKRNDEKAFRLLNMLRMSGNSEVDAQIAALESRMSAKKKPKVVLKKPSKKKAPTAKAAALVAKANTRPAAASTSVASKVEQELIAKKRRYEAVMKQLQQEQKMLESQQAWAEGQ